MNSKDNTQELCLFIGIPVSMRTLKSIACAASDIAQNGKELSWKWVAPARYQVTLCYLGWTKRSVLPAIRDTVEKVIANTKAFDMRCRNLGAFPAIESADIVWAGVSDRLGEVATLAKGIKDAMEELGFPASEHEFHPHVTIGRLPESKDLSKLIQNDPAHMFSKTWVDSLILYETAVESSSSEYKKVATWSLQ